MRTCKRRTFLLASIAVSALLLGAAPPATAVIDEIVFGCRPSPSGPIFLRAGLTQTLQVRGFGVDLVQRVEDTGLGGVSVRIGAKQSGFVVDGKKRGTFVELEVTVGRNVRHGDQGNIRLKYPLGEDSFPVKLVDFVNIRSLSIEDETPSSAGRFSLEINRDYTLIVRGTNLSIWNIPRRMGSDNSISMTVLSHTDSEARLRIRSSQRGGHDLGRTELRDGPCSDPLPEIPSPLKLTFRDPSRPTPVPAPPTATPTPRPAGPTATPRPTVGPSATRVPQASFPDLIPILQGAPFRHLGLGVKREVNGQTFCNAIVAKAVQNTLVDITPGVLRWGVRNGGAADITGSFTVRLTAGAQVVDQTIVGLRVGETKLFDVPRPAAQTNVTRIGLVPDAATLQRYGSFSGGKCVQSDPQRNPSFEWQDPSFKVDVDTTSTVNEGPTGGETNNSGSF